ncbi:hypothetical protein SCHPADRAFT_52239 [Schizopora paradoxa]|uniref:Zn(2)-C6 fungal-type domain-containing protein n=1 Tax=Schizopora paradoxa TaxID=27342 RepID=A0A0H2SRE1_9AGAM|nr:hypothetical protein SCHPADRAFT_52239 [Schizopora paradoxa]
MNSPSATYTSIGNLAQSVRDIVLLVRNIDPHAIELMRAIAGDGNALPAPASAQAPRNVDTSNSQAPPIPVWPVTRTTTKKRNSRPCGTCSQDKVKCEKISENMCVRCLDKGLKECPSYKAWKDKERKPRRKDRRSPPPPSREPCGASYSMIA